MSPYSPNCYYNPGTSRCMISGSVITSCGRASKPTQKRTFHPTGSRRTLERGRGGGERLARTGWVRLEELKTKLRSRSDVYETEYKSNKRPTLRRLCSVEKNRKKKNWYQYVNIVITSIVYGVRSDQSSTWTARALVILFWRPRDGERDGRPA